jgi:hypothetical protein
MKKITLATLALFFINAAFSQLSLVPFQPETTGQFNFASRLDVYQNEAIVTAVNSSIMGQSNVFIFEKGLAGMEQVAMLSPSGGQITDAYGTAVCIFGDYAAVGALYYGENNFGMVYLYHKNNGVWEFQQQITAPAALPNHKFGAEIKMTQNQIFIGAPGYDTGDNSFNGAIYIFDLAPTVTFSQMITETNATGIGSLFDVENNTLVFHSNLLSAQGYEYFTYAHTGSTWSSETVTTIPIYANQHVELDNGYLYVGNGFMSPQFPSQIRPYHRQGTQWIADTPIIATLGDNFLTSYDVSGDHMLIGLASYQLLMPRKSPLLYYKKTNGNWTYQQTLYGNGTDGNDDGLGMNLAMSADLFIIGAPTQGMPNIGKAYYVNAALNVPDFGRMSVVWPNPTTGELFITNTSAEISRAEVYSITGSLLIAENTPSSGLDLCALSQGVYFVKLFVGDKISEVHKIVRN